MITKIAPSLKPVNNSILPLLQRGSTSLKDPKKSNETTQAKPTRHPDVFNQFSSIGEIKFHPTYVLVQIKKIIESNRSLLVPNTLNNHSNADLNTLISTIRGLINSLIIKDVDSITGIAALLQSNDATIPLWFELLARASRSQDRN